MTRYIDADAFREDWLENGENEHIYDTNDFLNSIDNAPAIDVVDGYSVGDLCFYGFGSGNRSLALVEIVKILNDERGVAELKFLKVFVDDTGNGLFDYLLRSGKTMNGSFEYLTNITPKCGARMDEEGV